ncbi:MAG TPA: dynamin family protein [Ignavibacteriales bacterium]|nr:dynamin family protein [Ignavibacteriales bacterium]
MKTEESNVDNVLQRLLELAGENNLNSFRASVQEEIDRLKKEELYLVVAGQFKRGKSTLINAILGEEILPTGVIPLTAVVTLIRYGKSTSVKVIFNDNSSVGIDVQEIRYYAAEAENPGNIKNVRYIEITYDSGFLKDGIVLIDSPGIGSLFIHNTQTTKSFIPKVDGVIFTLSVDPPLTEIEYRFLEELHNQVAKILFVLNKADLFDKNELEETLSYTKRELSGKNNFNEPGIIAVSARLAMDGEKKADKNLISLSGIPTLIQSCRNMFLEERQALVRNNSKGRISRLISELKYITELEYKTLLMPVNELREKKDSFNLQLQELLKEKEEFLYLLEGEISSLIKMIEQSSDKFQSKETKRLNDLLGDVINRDNEQKGKNLLLIAEVIFKNELTESLDKWRSELFRETKIFYNGIIGKYVSRTNTFLNRIISLSADIFDVKDKPVKNVNSLDLKDEFDYAFKELPVFMEIDLFKLMSPLLPDMFARKIVLKRIQEKIKEKVSMNCGRITSDYIYSVKEQGRKFLYEIERKISELIQSIQNIITAAEEKEAEGAKAIGQEQEIHHKRLLKLNELQKQILR